MDISSKQWVEFNRDGTTIIKNAGIKLVDADNNYDKIRATGLVGFTTYYLHESKDVDIEVFTKLLDLDSKLGTTNSEQLYKCLDLTTRHDLIKVNSEI